MTKRKIEYWAIVSGSIVAEDGDGGKRRGSRV
jgi:hypothetical protein